MSSTRSETEIVNRSLTRIGAAKRLASLATDTSPIGLTAQSVYRGAVETCLVLHPWDFALTRTSLAADAQAPAFGAARAFSLPGDCLRWLPPDRADDIFFEAEEEGGKLLTDAEAPLPVRYIRMVEDPRLYSPHFVDLLVYRLGLEMAYAVTALAEVSRLTEDGFTAALLQAKRIEGKKAPRRDRRDAGGYSWLEARS